LNVVYRLVTQKDDVGHQRFIDLAKLFGHEVPDSVRKNLANAFSGKHRQTETTKSNLNRWLNGTFMPHVDIDLYERSGISTPELAYVHHEKQYKVVFENLGSKGSFLVKELKKTFSGMRRLDQLVKKGASKEKIKHEICSGELFPKINNDDNLTLEINTRGVSDAFSLDWLLYFFACIEIQNHNEVSYLELMFEAFNEDIKADGALNPPFAYYIDLLKTYFKTSGQKISNEVIAEKLEIDIRELYLYRNGERNPSAKLRKSIIENGDLIYYMITFWVNLINVFNSDTKIITTIMAKISEYPQFRQLAQDEYSKLSQTEPN